MSSVSDIKGISFNLGIWLIIAGMCLIAGQFYEYVRYGSWAFISLAEALDWANIPLDSLSAHWYQAYKSFKTIPLSLVLIGLGTVVVWQST